MERVNSARVTINETVRGISIEIPQKRNWPVIIFLIIWLGGWLTGEVFAVEFLAGTLTGENGFNPASIFIIVWLIGWTLAGFFTIRTLLWMNARKETLSFEGDELEVGRRGFLFNKSIIFDLKEVKNFSLNAKAGKNYGSFTGNGIFKFDYGERTIKIANGLDEEEGRIILEKIKTKNIIKV